MDHEPRIIDYAAAGSVPTRFSWRRVAIGVGVLIGLLVLYVCVFMVVDSYWFRHLMGWV